jgi:hypothetical protein
MNPRSYRAMRRIPWITTPAGLAVMCVSLTVTHSTVGFILGAISAVTGWISLMLAGGSR